MMNRTERSPLGRGRRLFVVMVLGAACGSALRANAAQPLHGSDAAAPGLSNPVAAPSAVITLGRARFTVLTSRLIRMEWASNGVFEDHASLVFLNRRLPVPKFRSRIEPFDGARILHIDTEYLHLVYREVATADGKFTPDDLQIQFTLDGKQVDWRPEMKDPGNLLGTTRTLDGANAGNTSEPIGQGLISRSGWALVDDSKTPLFDSSDFRFSAGEQSPWPWVMERPAGDRQDWYFFGYGHDYRAALGAYIQVAGRIPMPPYFAFGAWWSRYWAYSDQELQQLIHDFRENLVPLDVLVVDMDWHLTARQLKGKVDQSGQRLGWTGFSWNKLLFPDPAGFLQWVHAQGIKVALNLHPAGGIEPWEARYPEMAKAMGVDPKSDRYIPFRITDKRFATSYMDIMHHPLEKEGVSFWWLDWQQGAKTALPNLNPTWWLNYVYFTDQAREGKRPILFGRWGGLGNHRYQVGFSGDVISTWDSLAFQPWFTATAANVGYGYWSHDIVGHLPGVDSPELFTRWVQFGAFSPILRTHVSLDPEAERRIWAYPEPYADIMRKAYQTRYALIPYIYTEARRTYDTGVAFLHPLYYDWPDSGAAYENRGEYMFGGQMLVAPVTAPADPVTHLATKSIWLPRGSWIEWQTGKHFTGPVQLSRLFSIDQTPVYVHPGAIIPMAPKMAYTGQKPVDPLILTVFPLDPGTKTSYTLYQDARDTNAYQDGQAAWTTIRAQQENDVLTLRIDPVRGTYPGMHRTRSYEVRLPDDWPPSSVTFNGKALAYQAGEQGAGWHYKGDTLTTTVRVAEVGVDQPAVFRITRPAGSNLRRTELDGFPGALERLHEASVVIDSTHPLAWRPDPLVDAMQAGDRITYHPDEAQQELARFQRELQAAQEAVLDLKDEGAKAQQRMKQGKIRYDSQPFVAAHEKRLDIRQVDDYGDNFSRVLALMQDARDDASEMK